MSVLALNLPVTGGDELVADAVARHRAAGEPLRLTLRQIGRARFEIEPGSVVHVCENPAVLAHAAMTLGRRCAPLVCVDGQPNSAVDELLTVLREAGSTLRFHGDFDWGGLRIAQTVIERHGAEPWRFTTTDYLAVADMSCTDLGPPPVGATAMWDPALVETMANTDRRVYEEQTMEPLLADLDTSERPQATADRPPRRARSAGLATELAAAFEHAVFTPACMFGVRHCGFFITEMNMHTFSDEDLGEWVNALDRWFEMHPDTDRLTQRPVTCTRETAGELDGIRPAFPLQRFLRSIR